MTISSTVSRLAYNGNGSAVAFSVSFKFIDPEDLKVYVGDALQVLDTDYTVTGGNGSTGTVTFSTAPASTDSVVILRDPAVLQETDYVANDPFPAETHERALDKLTMIAQRHANLLSRSMTLADSDTSSASLTLPSPESRKVLAWNFDETALENVDTSTLATIAAFGTANADVFSGDGVQTDFTLSDNPAALNNLDVSIGGVTQTPGVDYTWSSGYTLTFTSAPPSGTDNILVRYMQALAQGETDASLVSADDSSSGSLWLTVQGFINKIISSSGSSVVGHNDTTLAETFKSRTGRVVDTIAALKALDKTKNTRAFVLGYYSAGDGGGGDYYYDAADTTSSDNGGSIIVASDSGRWKLTSVGTVDIRQFGAKEDGSTDNSACLTAAISASRHVCIVRTNTSGYKFSSAVTVGTAYTHIEGISKPKILTADNGLFNVSASNLRFSNLYIDMANTTATSRTVFLFKTATVSIEKVRIESVEVWNAYRVIADESSTGTVADVEIKDFVAYGSRGTTMLTNDFFGFIFLTRFVVDHTRNSTAVTFDAVNITGNQGLILDEVDFLGGAQATASSARGLVVTSSDAIFVKRVSGDTMGGHAMYFDTCNYIHFTRAIASLCYNGGIYCVSCGKIDGGGLYAGGRKGIGGAPATINGIEFVNCGYLQLQNVIGRDCTGHGVVVNATTAAQISGILGQNNTLAGFAETNASNYGIYQGNFSVNVANNYVLTGAASRMVNSMTNVGSFVSAQAGPGSF